MSIGWLTPNSLRQPDGSWRIKSDGDALIPNWQFPNYSGTVMVGAVTPTILFWDSSIQTLQALINSIIDATATKPYLIIIQPGRYTLPAALYNKPYVNLRGSGGRGRMTIFTSGSFNIRDADLAAGVNRFRVDGIRFETCPVNFICTSATKTLVVEMDDCPCNGASPINTQGNAYGAATTMVNLAIRNMNIDHNTNAQQFQLSRVSFWNSTLLGLYFLDSDAYWEGCDLASGCNVVNSAASVGGWFEFGGCKIDTMVANDPTSQSVLATLCGSNVENCQLHGTMHGAALPGAIANWGRWQPGTYYYCHSNGNMYVKTGLVGDNTWTVAGLSVAFLPAAEAVTIAGGTFSPTLPVGPTAVVNITGAGGLADDLDSFTVPAAWVGKLILCKMAGAGVITIKRSATIVMATDVTLDAVEDRALFEVTAANTVVKHWNVSNA
jgi:hypothetical protein